MAFQGIAVFAATCLIAKVLLYRSIAPESDRPVGYVSAVIFACLTMVKLMRDVGYDISDDIPCIPQFSKYSDFNTK